MCNIKKLLLIFTVILLSQYCFSQNSFDLSQSVVEVRNTNAYSDVRLMIGSLIQPDKIITFRRWAISNNDKLNMVVDVNCHNIFFDRNTSVCLRTKVKEVIPYKNENNFNNQNKTENSLVILVLEKSVESVSAKPVRLVTIDDTIDGNNCFYIRYEYGSPLPNPTGPGQYSKTNKISNKASEFNGAFNIKNFIDQSKFDVANVIAESSLRSPENQEEQSFQDFITRRVSKPDFYYRDGQYSADFIDYSSQYLGTPLYCSIEGKKEEYVQVGVVSSASSAIVHNVHNLPKSVLLLRYIKIY